MVRKIGEFEKSGVKLQCSTEEGKRLLVQVIGRFKKSGVHSIYNVLATQIPVDQKCGISVFRDQLNLTQTSVYVLDIFFLVLLLALGGGGGGLPYKKEGHDHPPPPGACS